MTPQQIGREIDVAALREMLRRKEQRRASALRWLMWRLPQAAFFMAMGAWATWFVIAGLANGAIR